MNGGVAHVMLAASAALLKQGRILDHLSRQLTVAALLALIAAGAFGVASPILASSLGLAVLAGLAEAHYGIRVGFDAALFERLGEQATMDLASLDAALVRLALAAGIQDRPAARATHRGSSTTLL